jgi:hypothetical protein
MYKNLIFLIVITISSFIGCGGGSDKSKSNQNSISKELKSLIKANRDMEKSLDNIPQPQSIQPNQPIVNKSCSNGGTMNFTTDFNQTAIANNPNDINITMTTEATNCIESDVEINGKLETKIRRQNSLDTITMTYLTDFTINHGGESFIIKEGSKVVTKELDENRDQDIVNMEIIYNGESYKAIDLKSIEIEKEDETTISYNISGKEIVEGKTFIVDESYDHSKTPFVYDYNGNLLKGGIEHYTNDQNHYISIEAVDKNRLKISVDEDRDGKIDKEEIIDY